MYLKTRVGLKRRVPAKHVYPVIKKPFNPYYESARQAVEARGNNLLPPINKDVPLPRDPLDILLENM